jgi:hypothetical protein
MDNPEKLAALSAVHKTQDEDKQNKKHNAENKTKELILPPSPHF